MDGKRQLLERRSEIVNGRRVRKLTTEESQLVS